MVKPKAPKTKAESAFECSPGFHAFFQLGQAQDPALPEQSLKIVCQKCGKVVSIKP